MERLSSQVAVQQYALVCLIVLISTLVGVELHQYVGFGFTLIYPPVIAIVALNFGRRPALLAIVMCVCSYWYFVLQQQSSLIAAEEQEAVFVISLTIVLLVIENLTTKLRTINMLLSERTAEVERINSQLKTTMQQREDFTAALSHDLKNPLIGCALTLEGLHKKQKNGPDAEIIEHLMGAHKGLLQMLGNILDCYRCDETSYKPKIVPTRILTVIDLCKQELNYVLKPHNLDVKVVGTNLEDCTVAAEAILLRRVILNLLGNAARYSPNGTHILIDVQTTATTIKIAIRDPGPGVPVTDREKLFQRFTHDKTSRARGGTGLGLYVSRLIVELHGGTISYEGAEVAGLSTFNIFWPRFIQFPNDDNEVSTLVA